MTTHTQSNTFVDPVCGMSVDPATAAAKTCYDGVEIYFCAQGCKQAFEAHPDRFMIAVTRNITSVPVSENILKRLPYRM